MLELNNMGTDLISSTNVSQAINPDQVTSPVAADKKFEMVSSLTLLTKICCYFVEYNFYYFINIEKNRKKDLLWKGLKTAKIFASKSQTSQT